MSKENRYIFRELKHNQDFSMLSMLYGLRDGNFLLVSRPMNSIDESIAIASRFTLFTGLFFLLCGTFAAFFMSKFITDPIGELKSIAESMSELDFSRKYRVRSNDEIGELGHSINSLSDQLNSAIGRLNRMNTNLLQEIEKERKIDEMRQNFIASVSHELRTPISLIEGYAEGLIDNVADDREKRISYCHVIMEETEKMEKHVRDLLTLSQLQSGVLPLEYSCFDINSLINRVIENFETVDNRRESRFLFTSSSPLPVRADRVKTEQVISNYLKNALSHGKKEGKISLAAERTGQNKIRVYVCNSGDPIDEEDRERIWESYYKVDKARTRQYGGCGLGLSIVKAIQDQHKNGCGVENRAGSVCFWFELDPADADSPETGES